MDIAAVNKVPLGVKIPCTFSSPSSTGEFVLLIRRCVFPVGAFSPPGASPLVLVLLNIQTSSLMGLRGLLGVKWAVEKIVNKQLKIISRKNFSFSLWKINESSEPRFYVKSILVILEFQKMLFCQFWRLWITILSHFCLFSYTKTYQNQNIYFLRVSKWQFTTLRMCWNQFYVKIYPMKIVTYESNPNYPILPMGCPLGFFTHGLQPNPSLKCLLVNA